MTSVPEITRILTRIHEWQEGHGKPGGRADAARRLDEAHKLLDEIPPHADRGARDGAARPAAMMMPDLPARIGPVEFGMLGGMVAVRCPASWHR